MAATDDTAAPSPSVPPGPRGEPGPGTAGADAASARPRQPAAEGAAPTRAEKRGPARRAGGLTRPSCSPLALAIHDRRSHTFYTAIGPFGAFNAHYIRDTASFEAALGVGRLAMRRPSWRVPVLALATVQFVLHSANHLIDIANAHPQWTGYFDFFSLAAADRAAGLAVARGPLPRGARPYGPSPPYPPKEADMSRIHAPARPGPAPGSRSTKPAARRPSSQSDDTERAIEPIEAFAHPPRAWMLGYGMLELASERAHSAERA